MTDANFIYFKCIEVVQPIGTFYLGVINHSDLVQIAFAEVRRKDRRALEEYLGIQRDLASSRVTELKKYVNNVDATFPTNVILAIEPQDATFDQESGMMKVRRGDDVAKIIDGQHRIAGLEAFSAATFQINAAIFVDMDMEDQAMVFATINLKQTKVNKSLAYDLYEYAVGRSPQKTCHNIAKLLNGREGSPFRNKIKILGVATGLPEETLTQAAFVDRLMRHISSDPMKDRDVIKRGQKLKPVTEKEAERLCFRNFFIEDLDAVIARNISNYFEAIALKWHDAWFVPAKGNILSRTTGFGALMRFLRLVYQTSSKVDGVVSVDEFRKVFEKIEMKEDTFTTTVFIPGAIGENDLYKALCAGSGLGP